MKWLGFISEESGNMYCHEAEFYYRSLKPIAIPNFQLPLQRNLSKRTPAKEKLQNLDENSNVTRKVFYRSTP